MADRPSNTRPVPTLQSRSEVYAIIEVSSTFRKLRLATVDYASGWGRVWVLCDPCLVLISNLNYNHTLPSLRSWSFTSHSRSKTMSIVSTTYTTTTLEELDSLFFLESTSAQVSYHWRTTHWTRDRKYAASYILR